MWRKCQQLFCRWVTLKTEHWVQQKSEQRLYERYSDSAHSITAQTPLSVWLLAIESIEAQVTQMDTFSADNVIGLWENITVATNLNASIA